MDFLFSKARKPHIAVGALALLTAVASAPQLAVAQGAAAQQAAGQQPAGQPTKNYKDRAEYDLYSKITQTQDAKARLDLLNQWQDKYPTSDFAQDRLLYFVATLAQLAPNDSNARKMLLDKCQELLKSDPKNFRAMYLISVWGPAVGGTSPSADLQSQVDSAAHGVIDNVDTAFDPSKKPANVSDADFQTAKAQALGIAHNALAWEAQSKKDTATAENEYKASLQANPNQGRVSYLYAKMLMDDKKYQEALFEYARASEYTGAEAVPTGAQPQILDYFNKVYAQYHGTKDGADAVLTSAKTNALPPADFKIEGQGDIEKAKADAMNQRMASDPQFKLWYTIKTSLTGDTGDQFFNSNVKDAEIPGGADGVKNFSGTVISVDPSKVVLGVEEAQTPDATLLFSTPLPATSLDKIKQGAKLEFAGVADSYTKDPYMLTFKDPTIPGVPTGAPAKRPTATRTRKRPATK